MFLVIFFCLLKFRSSSRATKLDRATEDLSDAKNEAKIQLIKKQTEETLNSINDED